MLYKYQHHNPCRPIDWRYQRVVEVVRDGQPGSRSQDDDKMRTGYQFLRQWDAAKTKAEKELLFLKYPALTYAYQLHSRRSAQQIRFVIEARLLAGESDEEIAEKVATLPQTVYWYEALFFCVRDRLNYTDYIVDVIRKQATRRKAAPREATIQMLGYFGGPVVLEHALYGFGIGERPAELANLAAFYDRIQSARLRVQAVAAAMDMEVDQHNVMPLLETHRRLMEMDRETNQDGSTPELLQAVDGMLSSLKWEVGRRFPGTRKPTLLDEFKETAVELPRTTC